jgi:hypothetical protein
MCYIIASKQQRFTLSASICLSDSSRELEKVMQPVRSKVWKRMRQREGMEEHKATEMTDISTTGAACQ